MMLLGEGSGGYIIYHYIFISPSPRSCPVVLLSEDRNLCSQLNKKGIRTETIRRVEKDTNNPVKVLPARYLTKMYKQLGERGLHAIVRIRSKCIRTSCVDRKETTVKSLSLS